MKTKNIFRMLLVAAALLMGANNVKAETRTTIFSANNPEIGNYISFDYGVFNNAQANDKLIVTYTPYIPQGWTPVYKINFNDVIKGTVDASGTVVLTLTSDAINSINKTNPNNRSAFIQGEQIAITQVVLVTYGGTQTTTYSITIDNNIQHGTVSVSGGKTTGLAANETVTLTATPASGYEFGAWNVKDASNNAVTVTNNQFSMPASNVTVSATFNETTSSVYNDVVVWSYSGDGIGQDLGNWSYYTLPDLTQLGKLKCDGTDKIRIYGVFGNLGPKEDNGSTITYGIEIRPDWNSNLKQTGTGTFAEGYFEFENVPSAFATALKSNTIVNGYNLYITSIVINPTTTANFTYRVTAAETTNGTVTLANGNPRAATTYTFSVTPNANYEIDNVWITDVSGNTISNAQLTQGETTNGATAYTFVVPTQNVVIHATFKVAQQSSLHVGENVVWQGDFNHESYSVGQLVSTDLFKLAHAGDKVRIYGTFSDGWATEFMYDNNGWQLFNIAEWGSNSKAQSSTLFNYSDAGTYLEFTLTQEHLDIINNNNIQNCVIHGENFHSTKLVIYVAPTYTINYTISGTSHGGFVSNNPASAKVGASVTFGIAVDEGYNAEVYATYGDNNTVLPLTPGANGQYSFTMPEGNVTVTLSFTEIVTIEATINGTYGAITFSCEVPVVIPSGITAYYAKQVTNSTVELLPITGGIIPAETGVVLFGDAGTYTFTEASSAGTAVTDNLLQPVLEDGGYRSNSAHEYVLTWHDHLVFAQTGTTAADLAKRQAYLAWNGAAGSRLRISIVGEGTGISTIEAESIDDDVIYNLRGQRVEHPTKGIYIIGGKKVVIK